MSVLVGSFDSPDANSVLLPGGPYRIKLLKFSKFRTSKYHNENANMAGPPNKKQKRQEYKAAHAENVEEGSHELPYDISISPN